MQINEPGGHIDQLVRQTRMHHVQLSQMADVKANILLTVSSLMLTFSLPYVSRPVLQWPALVMILFCGLTAWASILSLIPKMPAGRRRDKTHPMFNLLFFGSFADLEYQEFVEEMEKVCNDHSKTYEAQVREIYLLGVYLAKQKYFYLRTGYQLFIAGLFFSGILLVALEVATQFGYHAWVLRLPAQ